MQCFCRHVLEDHKLDEETGGYYECCRCDCEAFETPSFNDEDDTPDELEF